MSAVLGIDLASASWTANGSALVAWADAPAARGITRVEPACIEWPLRIALMPEAMADAIDACARRHGVRAVAIDGPHAWRDPARGADGPGVGRWSESLVRAQGKAGVRGHTSPRTQLGWTSFSIAVFDALLARPWVRLADPGEASGVGETAGMSECAESRGHAGTVRRARVSPLIRRSPGETGRLAGSRNGYLVLETYPTATWRAEM